MYDPYKDGYQDAMEHAVNELRYWKDYPYSLGVDDAEAYLWEKYHWEMKHAWLLSA